MLQSQVGFKMWSSFVADARSVSSACSIARVPVGWVLPHSSHNFAACMRLVVPPLSQGSANVKRLGVR
eukprot:1886220-Rhodomonas_salina.1